MTAVAPRGRRNPPIPVAVWDRLRATLEEIHTARRSCRAVIVLNVHQGEPVDGDVLDAIAEALEARIFERAIEKALQRLRRAPDQAKDRREAIRRELPVLEARMRRGTAHEGSSGRTRGPHGTEGSVRQPRRGAAAPGAAAPRGRGPCAAWPGRGPDATDSPASARGAVGVRGVRERGRTARVPVRGEGIVCGAATREPFNGSGDPGGFGPNSRTCVSRGLARARGVKASSSPPGQPPLCPGKRHAMAVMMFATCAVAQPSSSTYVRVATTTSITIARSTSGPYAASTPHIEGALPTPVPQATSSTGSPGWGLGAAARSEAHRANIAGTICTS